MQKSETKNNSNETSMSLALENAGVDFDRKTEAKKSVETPSIINNKGSQKILRPRKTDYLRFLNHVSSKIQTLRDYVDFTPEEEFDKDFRQRQGKPSISMDTELRHRLHILYENVTSTMTLFEGGNPKKEDDVNIDTYLKGVNIVGPESIS